MEPQLIDAIIKYVTTGGSGAGGFFVLFLAYKYLEKRRNGNGRKNSSTTINSSGAEIIGVKIEAMSTVIETKIDSLIDEQRQTRRVMGDVFKTLLEKPCMKG